MIKDNVLPPGMQVADPLLGEIEKHNEKLQGGPGFPVDVFPEPIRHFVDECGDKLNHTPDYLGSAILSVVSTLIGSRAKLRVKDAWQEKCNLYMIAVGRPGDGKTHATSHAFKFIENRERAYYDEYKSKLNAYKADQGKGESSEGLEKPRLRKRIVQDFTIEALMMVHAYNDTGLTIKIDEAMGFFKNIGRYNSSGELEQYLSLWSGQPISVDRKTTESIRIDDTFVGLIGTIQSKILSGLTKDDKASNGFLDRLLWVYPDKVKKQYWGHGDIDADTQRNYDAFCNVICNWSESLEEPALFDMTTDAREYLIQWQNYNTDNQENLSDVEISINRKLEQYVLRFAIILEVMEGAVNGTMPKTVSESTIKKSIRLYDYFQANAMKVRDTIDKVESPLETLPDNSRKLYLEIFKTANKGHVQTGNAINCAILFHNNNGDEISYEAAKKR